MALFTEAGGHQPMQAEVHEQFRFLEVCPERWVISPNHFVEAHQHPMANHLPRNCDAYESHLSLSKIGAYDSNALTYNIDYWAEMLLHEWLETRARILEFLHPQACLVILERASVRFVWNCFLIHEVDLFSQESNGSLAVKRKQVREIWGGRNHMHTGFEDVLEHFQVKTFLVPEVVGKEREGAACAFCDPPHACAIKAVAGEARQGGLEQGCTGVWEGCFHCGPQYINISIRTVRQNAPVSPVGVTSVSIWGRP